MQTFYTKSFKIEAVKKFLNRAEGETYDGIASKLGIGKTTLFGWVKQMREGSMREENTSGSSEKSPQEWSTSEKFDAILETASMSEEEKNSYCRRKGIFPHHLESWKREFKEKSNRPEKKPSELKSLRAEIKALKKEIRRKDKALAEASALLILKKKVQEIWGDDEEL